MAHGMEHGTEHGTVTTHRDLRELGAAVRYADVQLRRTEEVAWSGRAAEGYRHTLEDLVRGLHHAVGSLEALQIAMTRHLRSVEEAQLHAAGGLPRCTDGRGRG